MKFKSFFAISFSRNYQLIILIMCWILIQFSLLKYFGIITNFEATKYIEQAQLLINSGSYSSRNFTFYSTEIILIAICTKLNIGLWVIVLIQMIANAFSILLFYKLIQRLTHSYNFPFFATLFFQLMVFYHLYNVYLFTESLFYSFTIIFTSFLFTAKRLNLTFLILLVLSLTVLAFTRPTGILFIPPTLFFLILRFGKKKALPIFFASIAGGLFLFYYLLNMALNSGGEFNFLLPYLQEHIICGVPTIQEFHKINLPVNKNSIEGLFYLIKNNNDLFLRLATKRLIAFWKVSRAYYSFAHNIFLIIYFYSIYLLILLGVKQMIKSYFAQTIFLLSYIALIMVTVMLSCDEWHNRFIFSILPFLLILSVGVFVKGVDIPITKNERVNEIDR